MVVVVMRGGLTMEGAANRPSNDSALGTMLPASLSSSNSQRFPN